MPVQGTLMTWGTRFNELKDCLEFQLIKQCAPTLANLKSAGLFAISYEDLSVFRGQAEALDALLAPKNVRLRIMRARKGRALVYCYRPCRLRKDMRSEEACSFLRENGYCPEELGEMLAKLSLKLCGTEHFPHEIGLFLGYPPADVLGFICHKGQNYKCCADWKVYANEEECLKLFEAYRRCREEYLARWQKGESIYRLTVDTSAE